MLEFILIMAFCIGTIWWNAGGKYEFRAYHYEKGRQRARDERRYRR